jgi:hypothetical protein
MSLRFDFEDDEYQDPNRYTNTPYYENTHPMDSAEESSSMQDLPPDDGYCKNLLFQGAVSSIVAGVTSWTVGPPLGVMQFLGNAESRRIACNVVGSLFGTITGTTASFISASEGQHKIPTIIIASLTAASIACGNSIVGGLVMTDVNYGNEARAIIYTGGLAANLVLGGVAGAVITTVLSKCISSCRSTFFARDNESFDFSDSESTYTLLSKP